MSNQPLISSYRRSGNIIYSAGVTSTAGDPEGQVRACFTQLENVLKDAGAGWKDVLKVNIYLVDLNDRERYLNKVWREYFPTNPPARTTVQAGLAPPVIIEMELVAVVTP
jgi:enamine deaminase RidA (YjgF/YER057c/UK114 family)